MARIPAKQMAQRVSALQNLLNESPEGLSVKEMVTGLKERGVVFPTSEYQAIYTVIKKAEANGIVTKEGKRWKLLDASDAEDQLSDESSGTMVA
jgi:hypothetical protein